MSFRTADTAAAPGTADTTRTRDWLVMAAAVIVSLIALHAVFLDNGQIIAATGEHLHEFTHDGRHLFGAPCH